MDAPRRRLAWSPALPPMLACAAIAIAVTLWPADVPWSADEAAFIGNARAANAAGRLAAGGLHGTVGVQYGPLATQIYQLLLLVRDDVPTVVRLRAAICATGVALALRSLARSLGASPWLAVLPMLSPFFWFFARVPWDNTFALPLGALLLASWASYLRDPRRAAFVTAAATAAALPLLHPMTLPLAVPVAVHALATRPRAFARHAIALGIILAIVLVTHASFLRGFDWTTLASVAQPSRIATEVTATPRAAGLPFPLFSGRLLSAYRFYDARGPEVGLETTPIALLARRASAVAYALVWLGLATAIVRLARLRWRREALAPSDTIAGLCVAAFALQSLLHGSTRLQDVPHYYSGTWTAAVVFLWWGLRALAPLRRLDVVVGVTLGASLTICTVAFALDIHRNDGGRVWHGPTLGSLLRSGAIVR